MLNTLIAIFPSRDETSLALKHLSNRESFQIQRAVVVVKAATGEAEVLDDQELTPVEARRAGGTLGALMTALGVAQLGALSLPGIGPLIAIGAGALMGGMVGGATGQFAAQLIDFGFKHEQIDKLTERLEAEQVALIVQVDVDSLPQLRKELHALKAEIFE